MSLRSWYRRVKYKLCNEMEDVLGVSVCGGDLCIYVFEICLSDEKVKSFKDIDMCLRFVSQVVFVRKILMCI